jgi:3-methylcrotonyl-CoA carboxylase alpha subunit
VSRIRVIRTPEGVWVGWPGGARFLAALRPGASAAAAGAADDVRAPMTARVVRVEAAPGSDVKADDLLVVLQAMKMEFRLTSPRAGRVEAVRCKEGELVEIGAVLVSLAPETAGGASA